MSTAPPKISQLRASIPETFRLRSTLKGVSLFLLTGTLYVLTFIACLAEPHPGLQFAWGFANSVCISVLFIIGHDACHGSLTPSNFLNQVLGRLAFLPSWHPFTSWHLAHNQLHHCFTNLRTKDYVWVPLSKAEYDALPAYRRALERHYRTLAGVGSYYLIEIWYRHLMFPRSSDHQVLPRFTSLFDRGIVAVFALGQIAIAAAVGWPSTGQMLINVALAVIVPQLLWNWFMGLVILLHHTHPKVRWYDDPEEWSFYAGQVQGTVHVKFPWPLGPMLHHIMEHTAHHIDPRVPLYNLPAAQLAVEQSYAEDVIVSPFKIRQLLGILRQCKLYDYRRQCWLAFDGTPTTEPAAELVRSQMSCETAKLS
ncbi:Delta(12)-fatty-acid desaturase [Anatilimnocola aggregata]|uniref:Delta(12)-fatty-acid desaturase n=1 Tax=Anatilimnocola aggregata TaxID=2528021 RepID=A0A517YN78_9BACT|nr:fatty acid desaturase [Anatilimnocola aggregata]QDU31671.1 Delta(12)-fatty-acid desaturase [Anatilimnocola aggregata]